MPFFLGIGYSDQAIGGLGLPLDLGSRGAPGCALRTSWDATEGMFAYGGRLTIAIPNAPNLVGMTLHYQGAEFHPANNSLGVATSNLLSMRVVQ